MIKSNDKWKSIWQNPFTPLDDSKLSKKKVKAVKPLKAFKSKRFSMFHQSSFGSKRSGSLNGRSTISYNTQQQTMA